MGWFKMIWGGSDQWPPPVSKEEFERTKREYDRKLQELEEAISALHGEPDRRYPHAD